MEVLTRNEKELINYLVRIRETWAAVLPDDEPRYNLDAATVDRIQGRCLALSKDDDNEIKILMSQRQLFPSIKDDLQRSQTLLRLRSIPYIIPSIYTFLEDTKYLEPCAKIMKILPKGFRGTISQAFNKSHNGQRRFREQIGEDKHYDRDEDTGPIARRRGYVQLWLYAFRHFACMVNQAPRKDPGKPKPVMAIERIWWYQMASLLHA